MRTTEVCEWNPEFERGSEIGHDPGACTNPASLNVGADGKWHLCETCADLPKFARLKKRLLAP